MFKVSVAVLAASATLLSSCATIFTGTTQNINFQAVDSANNEPLKNVVCVVRNGNGMTYPVSSNPGTIRVEKGEGALTPDCKAAGYKQTSYAVGENFNSVALVNVLFWPGFLVDMATGSMHKYPSHMTTMMQKE
jgi:hypothetical protein